MFIKLTLVHLNSNYFLSIYHSLPLIYWYLLSSTVIWRYFDVIYRYLMPFYRYLISYTVIWHHIPPFGVIYWHDVTFFTWLLYELTWTVHNLYKRSCELTWSIHFALTDMNCAWFYKNCAYNCPWNVMNWRDFTWNDMNWYELYKILHGLIDWPELTKIDNNLSLSKLAWSLLSLPDIIWDYLRLSETIWDYLSLSELIWDYLSLPELTWANLS